MKISAKLAFALVVLFLFSHSHAQAYTLNQGAISLSGNTAGSLGISNAETSTTSGRQRTASFSAGSGYFVKDNLELGVLLSVFYVSQSSFDSTAFTVQPNVTMHTPVSELSNIFYGVGIGYSRNRIEQSATPFTPDETLISTGLMVSVKFGWEYFFNDWSTFQMALNAAHSNTKNSTLSSNREETDQLFSSFGFSVYFK